MPCKTLPAGCNGDVDELTPDMLKTLSPSELGPVICALEDKIFRSPPFEKPNEAARRRNLAIALFATEQWPKVAYPKILTPPPLFYAWLSLWRCASRAASSATGAAERTGRPDQLPGEGRADALRHGPVKGALHDGLPRGEGASLLLSRAPSKRRPDRPPPLPAVPPPLRRR